MNNAEKATTPAREPRQSQTDRQEHIDTIMHCKYEIGCVEVMDKHKADVSGAHHLGEYTREFSRGAGDMRDLYTNLPTEDLARLAESYHASVLALVGPQRSNAERQVTLHDLLNNLDSAKLLDRTLPAQSREMGLER